MSSLPLSLSLGSQALRRRRMVQASRVRAVTPELLAGCKEKTTTGRKGGGRSLATNIRIWSLKLLVLWVSTAEGARLEAKVGGSHQIFDGDSCLWFRAIAVLQQYRPRQADRQTDRQPGRQADRHKHRDTQTQEIQRKENTDTQTQTHPQTDTNTKRRTTTRRDTQRHSDKHRGTQGHTDT